MNTRAVILLVVLGLPAVGLLAFGPRGQVDVPRDRVLIRYWEKWTGVEALVMQRIIERFNATIGAEKKIWIEYNAVSNVDQRMLVATAGGDPPDLAGLFDHAVPQFADQGALTPLDDLAVEFGIDLGAFKPICVRIGSYNGKLYALPSTPYTIALYYNRRLFREAGLDPDRPPRTIAELTECARRLTKRDANGKIVQLGLSTSPGMLGWWHWIWPKFFDARLWDGARYRVDTSEALSAYRWITQRRAEIGNADMLAFEATAGAIEGSQNPFLAERLAMLFQGPWVSNWVRTYAPDLDYAVAPFPSLSIERQNSFASMDVFVIPAGSPHPRAAMVFLEFVLRPENMEELCSAHCKISPLRETSADFFENHPNPHIRVFDEMAGSPYAFGYPQMPMWAQTSTEMLFLLENVLRGVVGPEDAVRAAQEELDTIVSGYQRMATRRCGDAHSSGNTRGGN